MIFKDKISSHENAIGNIYKYLTHQELDDMNHESGH